MLSYNKMLSKREIYEKAYKNCLKKCKVSEDCDKFLKLDFKLRNCRTSKCKSFYKKKIKSLKKKKSNKKKH